jgi:hypothetical protein
VKATLGSVLGRVDPNIVEVVDIKPVIKDINEAIDYCVQHYGGNLPPEFTDSNNHSIPLANIIGQNAQGQLRIL